ncbi:MAG: hypothetical protein ABI364_04270, partial [Caldimonas sp.]
MRTVGARQHDAAAPIVRLLTGEGDAARVRGPDREGTNDSDIERGNDSDGDRDNDETARARAFAEPLVVGRS